MFISEWCDYWCEEEDIDFSKMEYMMNAALHDKLICQEVFCIHEVRYVITTPKKGT